MKKILFLTVLFVCLQTVLNAQSVYTQTSIEEVIKKGINPMDVGDLRVDAIKEKTFLHHLGKFKRLNNFTISNCDTLPKEIFEFKFVRSIRIIGGVKAFPNGAYEKLAYLTEIDIERMKDKKGELSSLPDDFGKLPTLKKFYAASNNLTRFPMALTKIISLEIMVLADNKIPTIPKEIGNLKFITDIALGGNPIKVIPKEIGLLKNLTTLDLLETLVDGIPIELSQISTLNFLAIPAGKITKEYTTEFKKKCVNKSIAVVRY